jgi:hypothetical protein
MILKISYGGIRGSYECCNLNRRIPGMEDTLVVTNAVNNNRIIKKKFINIKK